MQTVSKAAIVAGLVLGLVLAAGAEGAKTTHKLTGKMVDKANGSVDPNSKVSVKVVVKNGEPRRLKALRFDNLNGYCRDVADGPLYQTGEFSGVGGKNLSPRIENNGIFNWFSYPPDPPNPPRRVEFFGKIKKQGKRIDATLNVYNNASGQCSFALGTVALKKK